MVVEVLCIAHEEVQQQEQEEEGGQRRVDEGIVAKTWGRRAGMANG